MPKKEFHCVVIGRRKWVDQFVNTGQLCVVISNSWKTGQRLINDLYKINLQPHHFIVIIWNICSIYIVFMNIRFEWGVMEKENLLTDCWDKVIEVAEWEKWLRKLSKKQFQCSRDDVNVLPLAILEVQVLCVNTTVVQLMRAQQGALLATLRPCTDSCRKNLQSSAVSVRTVTWTSLNCTVVGLVA